MGNAFLALCDDSNLLWYNPAALAQVKGFHANLFNFTLGVDGMGTLNNIINAIFHGNTSNLINPGTTYLKASVMPMIMTKYFAFSIYNNAQGFWDLQSLTLPEVDIYAFNDIGLMFGAAMPVTEYFSLGVSTRLFQRSGVDAHVTTLDLLSSLGLAAASDFMGSIYSYLQSLAGTGYGIGINAGSLIRIPLQGKNAPTIQLAFTAEDIGGTHFTALGTSSTPPTVNVSYHAGAALIYKVDKKSTLNVVMDYKHIFESYDFIWKTHLGVEYRNPIGSLRVGMYQGNPTFGFGFEVLPHTKINFSSYAARIDSSRTQRWYQIQANIGFNPL
jgi:hypothetical protein